MTARFDARADHAEWSSLFTTPLTETPLTPVRGYACGIPSVLVLLRTLFNEAGGVARQGKESAPPPVVIRRCPPQPQWVCNVLPEPPSTQVSRCFGVLVFVRR